MGRVKVTQEEHEHRHDGDVRCGLPAAFILYPGHQVQTTGSFVCGYSQFGVDQDCA